MKNGRGVAALGAAVLVLVAGLVGVTTGSSGVSAVDGQADLQLAVSGPGTGQAGAPQLFTITLTNAGPETATAVVLSAPLPSGAQPLLLNGAGCSITSSPAGIRCDYPTLLNAETRTVEVTMYLNTVGTNVFTAAVASATPDSLNSDNEASATVTVLEAHADPGAYLFGPDRGLVGAPLDYHLNIGNTAGPQVYGPMTVTVTLPDEVSPPTTFTFGGGGLQFPCTPAGAPGGFSCSGGVPTMSCAYPGSGSQTFTCALLGTGGVGPGEFGTAQFTVTALNGGINDTATITGSLASPPGVVDTNSANNSPSVSTRLFSGPFPPEADLSVTQMSPDVAAPGSGFAYTVKVRNNGPDTAGSVIVTNDLPGGVTFQSAPGYVCSGAPALTCDIGSLAKFDEKILTINVLAGTTEGNATNLATATATAAADLDPTNNSASATTVIGTQDFGVTLDAPATAHINQQFDLTVTLRNNGPGGGTRGVVGALPEGLTYVSSIGLGCGSSGPRNFNCNPGPMAPGTSKTFHVTVRATVTGAQKTTVYTTADASPANDQAEFTTTVSGKPIADISATVSGPTVASVGDTVSFQLVLANGGPAPATNPAFNAYFPEAGFAGATAIPSDGGTCHIFPPAGGSVRLGCTKGLLAPNESLTVTLTMQAVAVGSFEISNQGFGFGLEDDTNPSNGFAAITLQVSSLANVPPVANPGGPYTGGVFAPVALFGTATDPDGGPHPLTFEWDFDYDGTTFDTQASGASVSRLYALPGSYTAAVRVSDGNGGVTIATASVSISAPVESHGYFVGDVRLPGGLRAKVNVYAKRDGGVDGRVSFESPAMKLESTKITSITSNGSDATIFGYFGTTPFRIDLHDGGLFAGGDSYRVRLAGGYDSGVLRPTLGRIIRLPWWW